MSKLTGHYIEDAVTIAIDELEADISDRRGLRQEWDQIDDDVKEQIRAAWRKILDSLVDKVYS